MKAVHPVMKDNHGAVIVRHPPLPGAHMISPGQDYAELPAGSQSPRNPAGGVYGALSPYQTEKGAINGEFNP